MKGCLAVLALSTALLAFTTHARAGLTQSDLAGVSLSPPPNAVAPLDLEFRDSGDKRITLGGAIDGRPALLLFVDYTCRTLCGPALAIASGALSQTDLDPKKDYRLIVVGLDPKDTLEQSRAMARQIGDESVDKATVLLRGNAGNIRRLTDALGYHYSYDAAADQFAHPAGVLVLTREGRVSRTLSSLALNPLDLRLALVEAGQGRTGSLGDRLTLLCYGFDAMHGVYTPFIGRALKVFAIVTIFSLVGFIAILRRRKRALPGSTI